ncbi:DDE transposase family protein [Halotia wernerae UHCC 0503]|nr:DDE transposase family protein [Halotia wernerae UHCC 0503]
MENPQDPQDLYIVKHPRGHCEIVPSDQVGDDNTEIIEQWGPFTSESEAIARRVGLIRAGKCQPV